MSLTISHVALWMLVLFQSLVLIGLVRAVHLLQLRMNSGMPIDGGKLQGHPLPAFTAVDIDRNEVRSAELAGRPLALLFVSPSCRSCTLTLEEMDALHEKAQGEVIVVCRGTSDECRDLAHARGLRVKTLVDEDLVLSRLFDIDGVPTAVLVNKLGEITSYGHPMRADELSEMIDVSAETIQTGRA